MLVFQEAVGAFVQISRKRGVMSKEGEKVGVSPYRSLGVRRLHSGAPDVDKFGRNKDKEPEKADCHTQKYVFSGRPCSMLLPRWCKVALHL